MKKVILLFWLMPYMALSQISQFNPGDVIISEIMADPVPPVLLPPQEYIEITNMSALKVILTGWKLISGDNKSTTFPVSEIDPGGYALLCSTTDTAFFSRYGKVIGLKSFPALTDGGKLLALADSRGIMIHFVDYSSGWYGDPLRDGGGWSLEMIDPRFPFYAGGNWKASVSPAGGTPCRPNSVAASNPDLSFNGIANVFPSDSTHVEISFSEAVLFPAGFADMADLSGEKFISVIMKDLTGRDFIAVPGNPLVKGKIYRLSVSQNFTDFAGNTPERSEFEFGLPEIPLKNEVVFNELLFNPLPGDADYIELFNNSSRPVDASWLCISSRDDATGKISAAVPVSEENILIMPGQYHCITSDRTATISRYYSGNSTSIFEAGTLPSMTDEAGHLVLMGKQLEVYDEVRYEKEMHFSLLSEAEGVSLEKVNPRGSSMDQNNWHSASGSSGWGTPGAVNSVYAAMPATDDRLQFSSTRITPDNDGIDDVLTLKLNLAGNGNVITVMIFDENGMPVRRLTENLLSGPETYLTWDCTDDTGSLLPGGIYIILVNLFNDTGKTGRWKRVCTIIR